MSNMLQLVANLPNVQLQNQQAEAFGQNITADLPNNYDCVFQEVYRHRV